MNDNASWLMPAFVVCAIVGAILAMLVMKMAKNKDDSPWLRESRRIAFFVASQLLLLSAAYMLSAGQISLQVVMLIAVILLGSNDLLLGLNVISLYLRSPPDGGEKLQEIPSDQIGYYLARAIADIKRLDQGQKLTHEYLQAMHNDKEMKSDHAIIYPAQFQPRKQ